MGLSITAKYAHVHICKETETYCIDLSKFV